MALNYHEVMSTDFGLLGTAAGKWESMAGELKKIETRYGQTVQKITTTDGWAGRSAVSAEKGFAATRYEYAAAQVQAKAIAGLLRDAQEKFTDLKNKLVSARDDAIAAGMTVSEQGHVAFDWAKLTPGERSAYHHDPDGQKAIGEAVGKWQKHIDDRVKAVTELDHNVKAVLETAVTDSNKDALGQGADMSLAGFNAGATGDLDQALKDEKAARDRAAKEAEDAKNGPKSEGGLKITGPSAGTAVTGQKYGKEGSAKAYADLFKMTAEGKYQNGDLSLSGIDDITVGARASANYGFTHEGLAGKAEISAGVRTLLEGRADYSHWGGLYGRTEGFAGGEAALSGSAGWEGVSAGAKAFAGGKQSIAGGGELAGIGAGATAEGWAGAGAEAKVTLGKGDDGKWHVGGKVGVALGIGGSVGAEFTVDTDKFKKSAGDAADWVGDTAGDIKDGVVGWFD
ncbi:hypothetical protein SUDANB120_02679 [Streptomyces sp. enrichment culture]|uniref:hypothetical protein n=1 Tax=Streptomyces sp. enrichment culture TaxID=1795815 RepID=UPI003F552BB7